MNFSECYRGIKERDGPLRLLCRSLKLTGSASAGSAALEFALLAPVFVLGTFGILTISIALIYQSMLDFATVNAARQIFICSPGITATTFEDSLCATMSAIVPSCSSQMQFYVAPATYSGPGTGFAMLQPFFASFDSNGNMILPLPAPLSYAYQTTLPGASNTTPNGFGTAKQFVLVQTGFVWDVIPGFMASFFAGGKLVLSSIYTLQACG